MNKRAVSQAFGVVALVAVVGAVTFLGDFAEPSTSGSTPAESSAPSPTPTVPIEDFCASYREVVKATTDIQLGTITALELKAAAARLERLVSPTTMPQPARAGLRYALDLIVELPDDAVAEDLLAAGSDSTLDESADTIAFGTWIRAACPV